MAVQQLHYETLLAHSSHYQGALTLLKSYRPYLELMPSMRRPKDSIVTIPLPNVRVREQITAPQGPLSQGPLSTVRRVISLPCDLALLMCDPEWKIKTGVEIFVFIHRPNEDFSELLTRWRQTQICVSQTYEWLMPIQFEHLLNEGADSPNPLFVAFPETPERIIRGLKGAGLPVVIHTPEFWNDLEGKAKAAQAAAAPSTNTPFLDEDIALEASMDAPLLDPSILDSSILGEATTELAGEDASSSQPDPQPDPQTGSFNDSLDGSEGSV